MLKKNNINILKEIEYPDHYSYSDEDINELLIEAEKMDCKIITTEKDYCRLNKSMREDINYVKIELSLQNEKEFIDFVLSISL